MSQTNSAQPNGTSAATSQPNAPAATVHSAETEQPSGKANAVEPSQPQYTSTAPMQQTAPLPTATTTQPAQQSTQATTDRAPLGLRGGLDYDHDGTRLLHDICNCFICCECMDDCCTLCDDTICC